MKTGNRKELECVLTFERVLEIFKDYLEMDEEVEVLLTKRGYLRIVWPGNFPFCDDGKLCRTPEELFDLLLEDCQSYYELERTKGRRSLTPEDIRLVKARCRPYLEK